MIHILFIGLLFCHFLGDYTHLSTNWMLSAKRLGKPLFPIFCHATVHATLQFGFIYGWLCILLGRILPLYNIFRRLFLLQLIPHFLIDDWKGRMNGWFSSLQNPINKWHWIIFGFDQFLHIAVIYITYEYILNL